MGKSDETIRRNTDLFTAIRNDDLNLVQKLVLECPDLVNTAAPKKMTDIRFMSPLQAACATGWHRNIAWFLLEHGADVNYRAEKTLCVDAYPVLFDVVCVAVWNARRYEWDGTEERPLRLVWKHTKEEADDAYHFLERMLALGADVNQTDHYGRNALFQAVEEARRICPVKNVETGEYYPGRQITEEMREDLHRIFQLLIEAGADKNCRSSYSKKTIREHYSEESVWQICGDLFVCFRIAAYRSSCFRECTPSFE